MNRVCSRQSQVTSSMTSSGQQSTVSLPRPPCPLLPQMVKGHQESSQVAGTSKKENFDLEPE